MRLEAMPAIEAALGMLRMASQEAMCLVVAIGLQESRMTFRRQMGGGPARGLWQFERGGGVVGVMKHHASERYARYLCAERSVWFNSWSVWRALEHDDILAAGFARLLLWTDPKPLPAVDDSEGAWNYYLRNWRPGKPHPEFWAVNHRLAAELSTHH